MSIVSCIGVNTNYIPYQDKKEQNQILIIFILLFSMFISMMFYYVNFILRRATKEVSFNLRILYWSHL